MDYEKAFDFVNRAILLRNLIEQCIDRKFAVAISKMYEYTYYLPRISNSKTGAEIKTDYGVTQGKTSSSSLFSFYVSDMEKSTTTKKSYIVQLADDTAILATSLDSLLARLCKTFEYSNEKHLIINMNKTKYLDMSTNPSSDPLKITNEKIIKPVGKDGYRYLGMTMIHSKLLHKHILRNINEKKGNIVKFFCLD